MYKKACVLLILTVGMVVTILLAASPEQKAQEYLGIDLAQLQADKDRFLEEVVPRWLAEAQTRHDRWDARKADPDHEGSYLFE